MASQDSTGDDGRIAELTKVVRADGDLRPLLAEMRVSDGGSDRARGALVMLGELDLDLLAQMVLDALTTAGLEEPSE